MADNIQIKDASGTNRNMRTKDDGTAHTPYHIVSDMPGADLANGKLLVGTARAKLRDNFLTFDTVNIWEQVQLGSGMAITVAGVLNGSRYLNIASDVTASQETILLSREKFKLPAKLGFSLSMSQRIANTEVFVELVSVNETTGVVETDATIASAETLNALNCASWKFDGVTATQAKYNIRADGTSDLMSAASTIATTAATGTTPNFLPAGIYEINLDTEDNVFTSTTVDTTAARTVFKRTKNCVDPDKYYKLRIRVKNLGTAPASSTDVRIHFVRLIDTTRFTVDMSRHFGRSDPSNAMPVIVAQMPTTVVQGTAAEDAAAGTAGVIAAGVVRTAVAPTTLIAGDQARLTMTSGAALVNKPFSVPDTDWQYAAAAGGIINTTDVAVRAAQAAGIRNYVTGIQLRNTNAVATEFVIKDGATVIWRTQLPANMADAQNITFMTPLRGTAATAVNVACIATGAAVYANLQGFSAA